MPQKYTVTFTVEDDGKMMLNRSMSKGMDGILMLGLLDIERQAVHRLIMSQTNVPETDVTPKQETIDGK